MVLVTPKPADLAAAAECLINQSTVRVPGMPNWDAITPTLPAHSVTVARDCLCDLIPYLDNSRFVFGKADNLGITALTACLSPNSEKMALLAHVTLGPIRQVNSRMQTLRTSSPFYNNKRQVVTTRTTLPEIKRSMTYRPIPAIIGPVQEFQNSPPADVRSMTEAVPSVPPLNTPSALSFGDPLSGPFNQFQSLQQLPNGESHRMNMTTSLSLHGRDCVSDCP